MLKLSKNLFSISTRQALVIRPPQTKAPKGPLKEFKGMTFPIYENLQPQYTPSHQRTSAIYNDRNPENCFTLQIIRSQEPKVDIKKLAEKQELPLCLKPTPKTPSKKIVLTTHEFQTSVKKGWMALRPIIGMHIFDAVAFLENSVKKVPFKVLEYLKREGLNELKKNDIDLRRIFISTILTQRKKRTKKTRLHAKTKMGVSFRDYCTFRFEFSEKPLKDFYKQLVEGKTPPMLSYLITEALKRKDANFDLVRKLQPFLHAKGRSMMRIHFRRRCWAEWVQMKEAGKTLSLKVIWEKRLEEEAREFETKYGDFINNQARIKEERIAERKEIFEKNQNSG